MTSGFTRREQRLTDSGPAGAAIAEASRAARGAVDAADAVAAARRDVTAGVLGPVLLAYVNWVLQTAAEEGLQRLFFLSRDGQVLLDLASRLQDRMPPPGRDLQLEYLHASREVWALAALEDTAPHSLSWVLSHSKDATLAGLLDRLGLRPLTPASAAALTRAGLDPDTSSRPLSRGSRRRLLTLLQEGALADALMTAANDRCDLVCRHLSQRGVFAGGVGLVDIVGRGNQHRAAVELAGRVAGEPPLGLMAGLQGDPTMPPAVRALQRAWLYDENSGWGPRRHRALDVLALAACAADHGTLLGYDVVGDQIVPRLASADNEPVRQWGLPLVRETLAALVAALDAASLPPAGQDQDLVAVLLRNVEDLWSAPTRAEAEAWGSFPFETGSGSHSDFRSLAPPATVVSVMRRSVLRQDRSWAHWDAAAVLRGSRTAASLHDALRLVRSDH